MSRKLFGLRGGDIRLVVIAAWLGLLAAPVAAMAEYQLAAQWGSEGSGPGQFAFETCDQPDRAAQADLSLAGESLCEWIDELWIGDVILPAGLGTDPAGIVYVADPGNARVQLFTADGAFVDEWDATTVPGTAFKYPVDVETDPAGNAYVADAATHKISKISPAGDYVTGWYTGLGSPPAGIAVDAAGNVYASLIGWFGAQAIAKYARTDSGTYEQAAKWGEYGTATGQIAWPTGIAVDADGASVTVADTGNSRIQRFVSTDGGNTYELNAAWGSKGSDNGQFIWPLGVALDAAGSIYVADTRNDRLQKLDPSGAYVATWGESGSGDGELDMPAGIAVDAGGDVYVVDKLNSRIQRWTHVAAQEPEEPEVPDQPGEPQPASASQSAATESAAEPAAGVNVSVTSPSLKQGRTKRISKATLASRLARGIAGHATPGSSVERLEALLVRKRGGRCYRVERPSRRVSCTRLSSKGLRTATDGEKLNFRYRPLASGDSGRHSASAKRLLGRMRKGEVLRSGSYLLTLRVHTRDGKTENFSFKLRVR